MKILIVYLNEDEKLKRCLDSLKKYSPDVVVDLVKADPNKTEVAEQEYQEYLLKQTEDVMIWHPDMEATEGWYEDLLKYYDKFDVIGCKIVYPNGIVNHYGGAINMNGVGFHPHQFSLNIGLTEPLDTAFVTGPSMVIKKKVMDKLKGWDYQFTYYIDVDFCFRARQEGFSVGVVPVRLIHSEGEDRLKKFSEEKTRNQMIDSHKRFTSKWMSVLSKCI